MLPRYSKQYSQDDPERDADSKPLLSQSYRRSSVESEPPHYPPSSSSAPPLPPSAEGRPNVEYTYDPVYPREGERQHALGVLGRTKRHNTNEKETIDIVQRGIPELAAYEPSRISLQRFVKSKGEMDEHWATVLDEAWEELANNPPSIIKVVLADGPGDSQQRQRRQIYIACMVIAGILLSIGVFLGFLSILVAIKP